MSLLLILGGVVPARAEQITIDIRSDVPAGVLPTWYEPSAFFGWTTNAMKRELAADAVATRGLFVESTHLILGPSTSLADYEARLEGSRLADEARLIEEAGGILLLQVHSMPRWLSSSSVTAMPPGCAEEWPTYQTVAPDPAKWDQWEAAVAATVTYFNVTHGVDNVWYQFWEEPDGPCFWTDSQAAFMETWKHFVAGARSADPSARVGGPEPVAGPWSKKPGEVVPLMQAFLEYSAAQGIRPDFVSYHLFGNVPEEGARANRRVLELLGANGLPTVPIVVGSWNPLEACYEPNNQRDDPSWPAPPSALGCWQTDNEMGASYSLAFMAHLAEGGVSGYQAMYQLDDADWGGSEEFPHDWGLRTNKNKHGIRKAIYHAQTIVGRMPRGLVEVEIRHERGADEYFPHLWALAGGDGGKLSVLLWSYVSSPGRQAEEVLRAMGYDSDDFARWGGSARLTAFVLGEISIEAVSSAPAEQEALERMKASFHRQRELVSERHEVELAVSGVGSSGAVRVRRYLIDATHNNAYATYVTRGLEAAIAGQMLEVLDTVDLPSLDDLPTIDLPPYAVLLVEIEPLHTGDQLEPPAAIDEGCACANGSTAGSWLAPLLVTLRRALVRRRRETHDLACR